MLEIKEEDLLLVGPEANLEQKLNITLLWVILYCFNYETEYLYFPDDIGLYFIFETSTMGWNTSSPNRAMNQRTRDPTPVDVEIIFCQAWGGSQEANYAESVIRSSYPNAKINKHSPGVTRNLEIKTNGRSVYNRAKGDGDLFYTQNSNALIQRIKETLRSAYWVTMQMRVVSGWSPFGKRKSIGRTMILKAISL